MRRTAKPKPPSATSPQAFTQNQRPWRARTANKRKKKQQAQTTSAKKSKRPKKRNLLKKQKAATPAVTEVLESLRDSLASLTDPRVDRQRRHLLLDIVIIAVCAVIAGAETWKDMAIWGQSHHAWLRRFLALPNGIPSRDTFRRVISRLDEHQFQRGFTHWLRGLVRSSQGRLIGLDGKTVRGSRGRTDSGHPLHIVSAWASEQHLTLGQVTVDSKSNEITAIPELLTMLDLKGALVTIDAMGCQKAIARQIVAAKGAYCLAVKDNQPHLHEDLQNHFVSCTVDGDSANGLAYQKTTDRAHGHEDERHYYTTPVPSSLRHREEWKGIRSVGMTISYQDVSRDPWGGIRYYILSIPSDVTRFSAAVRGHWSIENSLHWVMDVTFGDDACRIGKDFGGENVSWLRRFAISLLKNEPTIKDSIRAKRHRAGWDIRYLEAVLVAAIQKNTEN